MMTQGAAQQRGRQMGTTAAPWKLMSMKIWNKILKATGMRLWSILCNMCSLEDCATLVQSFSAVVVEG